MTLKLHGPLNTEGEDFVTTLILYDEPNFLHRMPKNMYLSVYYILLFIHIQ